MVKKQAKFKVKGGSRRGFFAKIAVGGALVVAAAAGLVFANFTPRATVANAADATGNWSDYASTDWLNTNDSRYASCAAAGTTVGSSDCPYLIENGAELAGLGTAGAGSLTYNYDDAASTAQNAQVYDVVVTPSQLAGKYVELANDIDLSAHYWTPVNLYGATDPNNQMQMVYDGTTGQWSLDFTGTTSTDDSYQVHILGNNHAISGLNINQYVSATTTSVAAGYNGSSPTAFGANQQVAGLFGYTYKTTLQQIVLDSPQINLDTSQIGTGALATVGALVGEGDQSLLVSMIVNNPTINITDAPAGMAVGGLAGMFDNVSSSAMINGGSLNISQATAGANNTLYAGGIAGYQHKSAGLSEYSSMAINITNQTYVNNYNYTLVSAGCLYGASTVRDNIVYAVCILNSYARCNLNVNTNAATQYVGGIAGQLEDSAVNNYFKGNITVANNGQQTNDVGQLFGYVGSTQNQTPLNLVGEGAAHDIYLDYYDATAGDPIGATDQTAWNQVNQNVTAMPTDPEQLNTLLENGREQVVQTMIGHQSGFDTTNLLAGVQQWCIDPAQNGGYPMYLQKQLGRSSCYFQVNFNSNGGTSVDSLTDLALDSTATEPGNPVREGYIFGGWYTDSDLTQPYNFATPVTGDLTLYAKWTPVANNPANPPAENPAPAEPVIIPAAPNTGVRL